jgi:3D (Asp-Asp-Asp) domain-containing protein
MNIGSTIQNLSQLTQQIQSLAQQLQGLKRPAAPQQQQASAAQASAPQRPFQKDVFEGGASASPAPRQQPSFGGPGGVNGGGIHKALGGQDATTSAQGTAAPSMTPTGQQFTAKGTGYYPDNSPMEGGFKDRQGKPLHTLQDFLSGKAPYVSVAMDSKAFPYGTKLRIPELEKKYGRPIEFRVVDTGGAFKGKGTSRIDICTANQKASLDPTINGKLTLIPQK